RLLEMALAIYERDLPADDIQIERTRLALAALDPAQVRPDTEATLLAAIERQRRSAHPSGARLASLLGQLAMIRLRNGSRPDETLRLEAIEVFRREFGDRHPQLGTLLVNLAIERAVGGDYSGAVDAIRSAEPCEEVMLQGAFGMASERRRIIVGE